MTETFSPPMVFYLGDVINWCILSFCAGAALVALFMGISE